MEDPGVVPATVIAQLTDTHIGPPGTRPYGFDTAEHLRRVSRFVRNSELDPAVVLLTGDLTDDGADASYVHLRELVAEELESLGVPVLAVLGNHDHRGTFRRVYLGDGPGDDDEQYHEVLDLAGPAVGGVRIVMCDSHLAGAVTGRLGRAQLEWLDAALGTADGRTCVVALHHPSVPRGVPRERDYLLEDRDEFAEVLAAHPVAAVLCGHSHIATAAAFAGTLHAAAPATAYLMDPTRRAVNRSYAAVGFAVCTVRDGRAIVNPVVLDEAV